MRIKKAISFLLTTTMFATVCTGLALSSFAADITATTTADPKTITSSEAEQTVAVSIGLSEAISVTGYSAEVVVPDGWLIAKKADVRASIANAAGTGSPGSIAAGFENNKIGNALVNAYGADEDQLAQLTGFTITYTVPAKAAAGDQQVGLKELVVTGSDGKAVIKDLSAVDTVTVSAASTVTEKPYKVAVSADKTEVSVGGTVNVNLDVNNSYGVTTFNAFYGTLTYDSDKFTYAGTVSESQESDQFNIANDETNGKLTIKRCGSPVTIAADAPELTLPFTAKAVGSDVAFTLSGVKVDSAENAETDALDAEEVTGSPLKVTVTEAVTEPIVTGQQVEYVGSSEANKYKLISATIDKDGYVPTYNEEKMYLVDGTGYATDTYYYVIPASETYDSALFGYIEGSATTITKSNDVNQSGTVDINDAQFVYNIYHGASPTANVVERLLLADTNGSQSVQTDDCVPIIKSI